MGLGKVVDVLASPLTGLAKDFTEARKTKKEAQAKVMLAEAEFKIKKMEADAARLAMLATNQSAWEIEMAKASATSWKDEYLVVLITVPLILSFIPGMEQVTQEGWDQLDKAPEWYRVLVGGAFAAVFGLRGLAKFWK